jgi:hypothetical protein
LRDQIHGDVEDFSGILGQRGSECSFVGGVLSSPQRDASQRGSEHGGTLEATHDQAADVSVFVDVLGTGSNKARVQAFCFTDVKFESEQACQERADFG